VARPARSRSSPGLRLIFPSQTSFLGLARDVTQQLAQLAGFDEATARKLALAVDEAATNSIEHAYRGAKDRDVEIRFRETPGEFQVDIVDRGEMVDPRAIPRVDLARYVSEGRTGGLGVHLMGKIMDSVTFRRGAGRNVCCLVKLKPTDEETGR
jgi:serine/threonine-protein kinase RsbW